MNNKKNILSLLSFITVLLITLRIYDLEYKNAESLVLITNFLIILISLIFMFKGDKYNYGLNKIFYLFSFFFFGISPGIEYILNVNYWRGKPLSSSSYLKMNITIIIILIIYQILYIIFSKIKILKIEKKFINYFKKKFKLNTRIKWKFYIISIVILAIVLYFNKFNLKSIFLRGGDRVERIKVEKMIGLIYGNFIKPMPAILLIIFKTYKLKSKKLELFLIINLLITNFPTSGARFAMAAIYIPVLVLYFKKLQEKMSLNKSLMLGLLFIFPLLDEMRRFKSIDQIKLGFKFTMFLEGHFDSYQNFMRVIENNIITNGSQLTTTLLFFVPRKLWAEKSIGSGAFLKEKIGLSFDNIGMNYFGEGYINYGYLGILLFIIIIAWFNCRFDKIYWLKIEKNKNFLSVIYLIMLGMEFFILRGDLLSSFAFTMGIITSSIFIYNLLRQNK